MYLYSIIIISIIFIIFIFKLKWKNSKLNDLFGRHVLVTGGSSGIGKYAAMKAAKMGANVTIVARNIPRLLEAVNEIRTQFITENQKIKFISIDLASDYNIVKKEFDQATKEMGPLYMLVNCAGMSLCGTLEEMSTDDIMQLINVNLLSTIQATKAVVKEMKCFGDGVIVITASQAAMCGIYGLGVYSATKFALRGFAEALSMETNPYGVKVTLALPPDTDTPGFENENKSKPLETRLISETSKLLSPEQVGYKIIKDALNSQFFCSFGFEGHILTIGCPGMAPFSSYFELICQVFLSGILRLAVVYYQYIFNKIILNCKMEKEKSVKIVAH